jgi:hypothetical protein
VRHPIRPSRPTEVIGRSGAPAHASTHSGQPGRGIHQSVGAFDTPTPPARVDKDVLLIETGDMNDEIDDAYRAKYHRYAESIVGSVVSPQARASTLKLVPH